MDPDDRIINASDEVVRKALIAICGDHSIERKALQVIQQLERHIAEEEIMKQQQQQQQQRDDDDNAAAARTTADGSLANKKRKAAREVHVCVQCKETFTEEENDERACCYHSGELEEGEDFWMDCFDGDPEYTVEEMFEDCPERVDWNCCQKNGEAEGCEFDFHRSYLTKGRAKTD